MSTDKKKTWGIHVLDGVDFTFKSYVPNIKDSTEEIKVNQPCLVNYPFANEERTIKLIDCVLDLRDRPKNFMNLTSVLQPTRETSSSFSEKVSKPDDSMLNIFDSNNFDDPFHSTELSSINVFKELESIYNSKKDVCPVPITRTHTENDSFFSLEKEVKSSSLLDIPSCDEFSLSNSQPSQLLSARSYQEDKSILNVPSASVVKVSKDEIKSIPKEKEPEVPLPDDPLINAARNLSYPESLSRNVISILKNSNHPNTGVFLREEDFLQLLGNITDLQTKYGLHDESIVFGCLYYPFNLNQSWRIACLVNELRELGFHPNDIIQTSLRLQTKDRHELIEALLNPSKINTKILQNSQSRNKNRPLKNQHKK